MQPLTRTSDGEPSDADLVVAARRGDAAALGLLLERHRPRLYATALRLVGYRPDAEDAVQETCLAALRHLGAVRDPAAVGAWLHAVLSRACLRQRRRGRVSLPDALPDVPDERASPELRVERLELRDWIWGALQRLPEALRVTAMLRYFGSYDSYDELAAILGVPLGTVRSRLSGTLGLLASSILRQRGLEVVAMGRNVRPYLNADLLDEIGVTYRSTAETTLRETAATHGPLDLIVEGTGYSPLVFEAMDVLGKNGVLVMVSVTGGDRTIEVPADRINQGFVLGNKVAVGSVNASRADFERGVQDLSQTQLSHPGWLARLLTHPVRGLERYAELIDTLTTAQGTIKVYCEVAPLDG